MVASQIPIWGRGKTTYLRRLGLSTIKALVVPRASLSSATQRPEPQKTGVYVLVGQDSDIPNLKRIYIGEGDTIINRVSSHNKDPDKDFWDEVVLFVSKDENLTKAHVRYVEARLIALAKSAKRSVVTNGTDPSEQGKLPEPDEVEMEEFISQARLLLGALGYDIFEPDKTPISPVQVPKSAVQQVSPSVPMEFKFTGAGFDATMRVDPNSGQFIVVTGSTARKIETPSLQPTYKNLRAQLIQNGVLVSLDDISYQFTQDFSFGAPTPAAQVVCGTTANGRTAWKREGENTTFADWQDAQLPAAANS
jgi:Domain of unknown function (DUF4357)